MLGTIVLMVCVVVILATGIMFWFGKATRFMIEYKNGTEEQRSRVDVKKLGHRMFWVLLPMAAIFAAGGILTYFDYNIIGLVGLVLVLPLLLIMQRIVKSYSNFDPDVKKPVGRFAASLAASIIFSVGLVVGVFLWAGQIPSIQIQDGSMLLSGTVKNTVAISDIQSVELTDTMPPDLKVFSGTQQNGVMCGVFSNDGGVTSVIVYAISGDTPYISITTVNGTNYLVGSDSRDVTLGIYQQLLSQTGLA